MKRIIGLLGPGTVIAALFVLAAVGVTAPPADHTANEQGVMHANNKDLPYSSHCTDCHAPDLLGGLGPSCFQCHDVYWFAYDAVNFAPPLDHTEVKGGSANHKPGFGFPFTAECTLCHGENLNDGFATSCFSCHDRIWAGQGPPDDHTELKGGSFLHKPGFENPFDGGCTQCHGEELTDGFAPSCYQCHGQIWAGGGPPPDHTELKGGSALHRPGFGTPIVSECTQCHGPNLDDGFAPSCYSCHTRIWAGEGPPEDHTEVKGGTAEHKPGFGDPFANGCTQCHGPNLDDGFAPSCFSCHGAIWAGGGPPTDHTELRGGFAEHKPGLGEPFDNGCTQCHGPNLDDGFATSCFTCHARIWAGEGPPDDHTDLRGGFAEHRPGLQAPFANNCTQCHGPNLDDGFAPSCFTCHGEVWGQENLPPVVDPGGPYSGSPGQPVGFDASGTVDPEGDTLTFEWDFGDGSDPTSPSEDPTAAHTYSQAGVYTAWVTVSDGVNDPVSAEVAVNISDIPPPAGSESWSVTTTESPPEAFTITFEHHATVFLALKDDGAGPPTLAIGVEFEGVIFWMDLWMELSGNIFWGTGNSYFGNIDRVNGTMSGVVFDNQGGVFTFSGTAMD